MKTKIYYEIQDNESWTSDFYKAKFEDSKQKVEILSKSENFKDTTYFTINKVEIDIYEDEIIMHRKEIATYWKDTNKWYIKEA